MNTESHSKNPFSQCILVFIILFLSSLSLPFRAMRHGSPHPTPTVFRESISASYISFKAGHNAR